MPKTPSKFRGIIFSLAPEPDRASVLQPGLVPDAVPVVGELLGAVDIPRDIRAGDVYRVGVGLFSTLIEVTSITSIRVYFGQNGVDRSQSRVDFERDLRTRGAVIVAWRGIDRFVREPRTVKRSRAT